MKAVKMGSAKMMGRVPTRNLVGSSNVSTKNGPTYGGGMSLLKRLFGKNEPPKPRVRVCVECGMPIAEHKEWCSILRGQNEMKRAQERPSATTA